jgi:hypothetical protein
MNNEEYEKQMKLLKIHDPDHPFVDEEREHERMLENFMSLPLEKQKHLFGAMLWRLFELEGESFCAYDHRSRGGSETPYEDIHEEARRFYKTGEYTTWGAAKKAVKLAKMNPGEFGKVLPTVDAVNKALKKHLGGQE